MAEELDNQLTGRELKVAIGDLSSLTMLFRNANGEVTGYSGYAYEQLVWLSLRLNFSLDMVPAKDGGFGALINGNWSGLRGQLQKKEVDIACSAFAGALGNDIMDLAVHVLSDSFGILVQYPVPQTSDYSHIMTFSINIWIGLFLSIVAIIGGIRLLAILYRKYVQHDNYAAENDGLTTLSNVFVYILSTLLSQGGYYQNMSNKSIKILVSTWCFATFVFVNIYSSCLTSYMSLTFQRPEINSFRDLAAKPNYQLVTLEGSNAEIIFPAASSGTMKDIGDKLRLCSKGDVCRFKNLDHRIVDKVLEGSFVAIVPISTFGTRWISKTISNHECRLAIAQETMGNNNYFMGVQKNSPFIDQLNKESFRWHSLGLNVYWVNRMNQPQTNQCRLQYNSRGESIQVAERARLKLKQFYVPCGGLLVGYVLALFQFIRERLICPLK